ncbi:MAG: hypothetical protein KJ729_02025 [Euryarchaeota archaeon]|nr:hypothetical protein [Euryarchaeota archaeon]
MQNNNIQNEPQPEDGLIGFRLYRFEVWNWGTFNQKAWKVGPDGTNSLLTGEIGSGKSTLLDGIITLLVPPHSIVYNKAAGASKSERNLISYIRGGYRNVKGDLGDESDTLYLRERNDYSVLLAYFYNVGLDQKVTLAQVLWQKNDNEAGKLLVVSQQELNINEHFRLHQGEKDVSLLKKRIRSLAKTDVFNTYTDYSSRFRSIFGIKTDEALSIFNKAVSWKSVDDMTMFVRDNMLDRPDIEERINELKRNYENLTNTYTKIQIARKQMELLKPLVKEADDFETLTTVVKELQECLDALDAFFAFQRKSLLLKEIESLNNELEAVRNKIDELTADLQEQKEKKEKIEQALGENKEGQRVKEIIISIQRLEDIVRVKSGKDKEYSDLLKNLGLPKPETEDGFYKTLEQIESLQRDIEVKKTEINSIRYTLIPQQTDDYRIRVGLDTEIKSLKQRKTQIPNRFLDMRSMVSKDLGISEKDLPFVAELLKVKDDERAWEGTIERVLQSFGPSMLVPEKHYKQISHYVDKTDLKKKLEYYRVPSTFKYLVAKEPQSNSLVRKVDIKGDSEFYDWIEAALVEKHNYICCDTIEQFQKEHKALTINGQTKGNERHVKDDRRDINDRSHYILGWDNKEKVRVLEEQLREVSVRIYETDKKIKEIETRADQLNARSTDLHLLAQFRDYGAINWQKDDAEIKKLAAEKDELERSSDVLKSLKIQLSAVEAELRDTNGRLQQTSDRRAEIVAHIKGYEEHLEGCQLFLNDPAFEIKKVSFAKIETFLKDAPLQIKTIDKLLYETRRTIDALKEEHRKKLAGLSISIVRRMQEFLSGYTEYTTDSKAGIEYIPEFRRILEKIVYDDLPKHEEKFRDLLRVNTVHDIVIFKSHLDEDSRNIETKIKRINESLVGIEYNHGTYIMLKANKIFDNDISEFNARLKECMADVLGDADNQYGVRFNKVKGILDRFNSTETVDINWSKKVADVRNWYRFSASEINKADGMEIEYYSGSSGKSGGQKEKMAYTILASALTYQFSIEQDQTKSRTFRLVVIDEAFGKGSDESTRYALDLFKTLRLQLLMATPLQKIHIIENYVDTVHFVATNSDGESAVRRISHKELSEELNKHQIISMDQSQPSADNQPNAVSDTTPQATDTATSLPQSAPAATETIGTESYHDIVLTKQPDSTQQGSTGNDSEQISAKEKVQI